MLVCHACRLVYSVLVSKTSNLCFRPEMVVGWYHSHPGFGCWLSGVDINTQQVSACLWSLVLRGSMFVMLLYFCV